MNEMINQIIALRGTEVLEFGQPKYMEKETEFDPLVVDVVDVLSELEQHEVRDFVGWDSEKEEEVFFHDLEDYLYYVYENHGQHSVLRDNTFNHNAPISNHIDLDVFEFEDGSMGNKVFVEMKTHLGFGDVRAHYTDSVLLEFESIDHFHEAFYEAGSKEVEFEVGGNEFTAHVNMLGSNIEVFEYGSQVLDYNDFPELDSLKATIAEELDLSLEGNEVDDMQEVDQDAKKLNKKANRKLDREQGMEM